MSASDEIGSRPYWVEKLHEVGWLVPPFVSTGWIRNVATVIDRGATRRLAKEQGIVFREFKPTLSALTKHCREHVSSTGIGDVGEIVSMLESFELFVSKVLFVNTDQSTLTDGINRHGMAHGVFSDKEFGSPLNFYKIINRNKLSDVHVFALLWRLRICAGRDCTIEGACAVLSEPQRDRL